MNNKDQVFFIGAEFIRRPVIVSLNDNSRYYK
jgi:hypothetical protein